MDLHRVFRNAENLFHSNKKNPWVQQRPLGISGADPGILVGGGGWNYFLLVFDELLIENENVLRNGVLSLTMSA